MFRTIGSYVLTGALILGGADAAYAQKQAPAFKVGNDKAPQTLNFTLGWFSPLGAGSRDPGDVLTFDQTFLNFNISDFKAFQFGAEYLLPIGKFIEAGAGVSFSNRTVDSTYTDFIANDGSEIQQKLKMKRVPLEFTGRVLPLGQKTRWQPYAGAGLAVIFWRYTEAGDFVDFDQGGAIFSDTFESSGSTVGPVVLFGVRYASDAFSAGFESRYQHAKGDLDPAEFVPTKVDLGGWIFQGTFGVRFD
jgi:hypothetical protein